MNAKTLAGLCLLLMTTTGAGAQPLPPDGSPAASGPPPASSAPHSEPAATGASLGEPTPPASDLHLSFTPYFWLTSFSGSIQVNDIQIDLDKSVIDIVNGSDMVFGLMGALDVEYKNFVFQFNGAWGTVEGSEEKGILNNGTLDADIDVDGAFFELIGGYRILDRPLRDSMDNPGRFKLDAYGGGRVTAMNVQANLTASTNITLPDGEMLTAGRSTEIEQSGDWFEPLVGLRGIFELNEHWMTQVRGDVGGFGVDGSEFAWQAAAVVGYRWHLECWDITLVGGYRALGQDYSKDDFNWDVVTHGPLLGLSFAWSF
jgi:hypothetical protein